MNSGKVVLGIIGAVAAGALLGILFAPDKGSKTRKKILDTGKDYVGDLKDKLEDLYHEATNKCESFISDTKDSVTKEVNGITAKEVK